MTRKNLGFANVKQNRRERAPRADEVLDIITYPNKKYVEMRLLPGTDELPGMVSMGSHWLKIEIEDREKKGKTRIISIPKQCLAYDPASQSRDSTKNCPYCKIGTTGKDGNTRFSTEFYALAIIRSEQENAPRKNKMSAAEKKSGVITKDSEAWSPVKVVRIPESVANKLRELSERNFVKSAKSGEKKAFPISHPKYGIDISIKYDKDAPGTEKYVVEKGERTALTEEELAYLVWDLNTLPEPDALAVAKEEAGNLKKKLVGADEEDGEDYDEDDKPSKKSKGKKKPADDEDEDEEDEDEDEDEEDDDPPAKSKSKGKSKPAAKGKKKPVDEEEDEEDEDEDEDDEDEDDDPPAKSKSKGKKKVVEDDDDDEDEDDEDEDEDEDDEDEEDDDPPAKSKSKSKPVKKPAAAKGKKKVVEDDDDDEDEDDEDDEDEDEDEDDDPPAKSKGKKPAAKSKPAAKGKKKKPADDEDDDDLDLDEDDDE